MRELKAVSLTRSLVGTKTGVMRCLELRVEGSYPLKSKTRKELSRSYSAFLASILGF